MRKSIILSILLVSHCVVHSQLDYQVTYYEGEWSRINKTSFFTALLKLEIAGDKVRGHIYWTYVKADSSDAEEVKLYRGKENKIGIEYIIGRYYSATDDIFFSGYAEEDPLDVIGVDKYTAKLCTYWKVIYGKTWSNGSQDGLVYFKEIEQSKGREKELALDLEMKNK